MAFPVHDLDTAPAGSRGPLQELIGRYGFVPNLAGVIAGSPAALSGLVGLLKAFDAPAMTLSPLEREVVALAVSVANRCEYCAAGHGMLAAMHGLDRAELGRLQQGDPLTDERLDALRAFTTAVVERKGWVGEAELERFLGAGFDEAQVLEVVMGVALKTFTNYVNHIARPPINEQFADYRPEWAAVA